MSADDSLSPYAGLAAKVRPEGSRDAQAQAKERGAREPLLRIVLRPPVFGWLPCSVLVDGQPRGTLRSGQRFEVTLPAGRYSVQVASGWLRSPAVNVEVQNGDIAQFVCHSHNSVLDYLFGLVLVYGVLLPGRFYWLKPFKR
jgi:hypothetical protein